MSRELLSPEGLRTDGRRAGEFRRIEVRLGAAAWNHSNVSGGVGGGAAPSSVDGSAYYSQGHTRVLAYVIGPRENKQRPSVAAAEGELDEKAALTCEISTAAFSFSERKAVSKNDRRTTELSLLIRQTFEGVILTSLFPGSEINLHVQILQNDGGVFASSINALTLALQNAGIPMRDMVCACTVGLGDTTPLLDLNFSERSAETPELVCASLVHSNKIVLIQEENKVALKYLESMIELALKGNVKIYEILKQETKIYSEAILRSRGMLNAALFETSKA